MLQPLTDERYTTSVVILPALWEWLLGHLVGSAIMRVRSRAWSNVCLRLMTEVSIPG
jgi:hypothetical protein